MPASADRNLLFGMLALQMDFIRRDQLIEAMHAWVLEKDRPLGAILAAKGQVSQARRILLDQLVEEHVAQHDHDPQKSLAALTADQQLRTDLSGITDPDFQQSVFHLPDSALGRRSPNDATTIELLPDSDGLRYRILRPHAKGGLGEVFVANDTEIDREVALKEIQIKHAYQDASRARFLFEAQVTGKLEHPGIVPVYGLGHYADGRPFYAMRLIKGESLAEAINHFHKTDWQGKTAQRLSAFRQLLRRFVDVCQAIAYAHHRHVLHRDLKPANVMLGKYGETLVVDWGLARLLDEPVDALANAAAPAADTMPVKVSSGSNVTVAGSAIGTPAYMSPEQAAGRLEQLGPASDVYSLGATLYVILTGRPSIEGTDLAEALRRVERGDFAAPHVLDSTIPRALDAVCLKAMSRRPADRYASCAELAADIEHWLADEPVAVAPDTTFAKAQRWSRKNPGPLSALAATVLVGLVGLAAGLILVSAEQKRTARARDEEQLARKEEQQQRTLADRQRAHAQKSEQEARAREAEARAVLAFVRDKVFAAGRPEGLGGGLGREVSLNQAIRAAVPEIGDSFKDQPLVEAAIRMTIGASMRLLGDPKSAESQFVRARELYTAKLGVNHPNTLSSMNQIANCFADTGRPLDALKLNQETLKLRQAYLDIDHPDTLATINDVADCYFYLGRYQDALKLHEEALRLRQSKLGSDHPDTLSSMNNVANAYVAVSRRADAQRLHEKTLKLRRAKLGADHPNTLSSMSNLANSYTDAGRHADALKLNEESLKRRRAKLGPDHPHTLLSMNNLAINYAALGRHDAALSLYEETLKVRKAKRGPDHPETLRSMTNLANGYAALGRNEEALKLREETLKRQTAKLGADHPDTIWSMWTVAKSLVSLERGAQALPIIDRCLALTKGKAVDPEMVNDLIVLRLQHFQKANDADGCRSTAALWENLERSDIGSLYNAACWRAAAAAEYAKAKKSTEAKADADRSMAWLKKAVAAGFNDRAHLSKDDDLAILRSRPDFQIILNSLSKSP